MKITWLGQAGLLFETGNNKIIIDPSHASGIPYMVRPMSLASIVAGCDGLIIEVHDKIEEALCDKNQAITIEELESILNDIKKIKEIL